MIREFKDIQYTLTRSRRKTASIYVERDGQITVIVPEHLTDDEINVLLEDKRKWIYSRYFAIVGGSETEIIPTVFVFDGIEILVFSIFNDRLNTIFAGGGLWIAFTFEDDFAVGVV